MHTEPLATVAMGETAANPDADEDAEWESILRVRVEHCGRVQDVVLDEPRRRETWTTVRQKIREAFALEESVEFHLYHSVPDIPPTNNTRRIRIDSLDLLRETLLAASPQPAASLSLFLTSERDHLFTTNASMHKNTQTEFHAQTRLPRVFSDPILLDKEDFLAISDKEDNTDLKKPFNAPNAPLDFGSMCTTPVFDEVSRSHSPLMFAGTDTKTRGGGGGGRAGGYSGLLCNAADVFRVQEADAETAQSSMGRTGEWMAAIAIVVFALWVAQ